MIVKVIVTPKKGVLNPEGKTIENSLKMLGYDSLQNVKSGKYFELYFGKENKSKIDEITKEICTKLLANTVIEDFTYTIEG
jgi:phosphoribosylformylglycinamidine synthase